ncbi:MAG TPA: hypothetical protein VK564_03295 [Thermodesulfobacteriota bacterium]|nr:hypothetical protein [Thermodesulfobacteriota bacterium]
MDKSRLDWVISGLTQYELTKAEEVFLKTASEDFDRNQALTEKQEARIEALYKLKSLLKPNKYSSAPKESPKKVKPRKPNWKTRF